jgi:hypothetical protein
MQRFDDTFTPHRSADVLPASRRCPRCIWPSLHPVASVDREHWRCTLCGRYWYLEDDRLRPVDPITCQGCAARSKSDCIELRRREFPRFTAGAPSDDSIDFGSP